MFCTKGKQVAIAPPVNNQIVVLREILTTISRTSDSINIPIIGPNIIALGEMDFIKAQTTPARQIIPFSFQRNCPPTSSDTPIAESMVPVNGIRRLWRKLPMIISIDPHILPRSAALIQTGLIFLYLCFINYFSTCLYFQSIKNPIL
jgi:hypothetical protein